MKNRSEFRKIHELGIIKKHIPILNGHGKNKAHVIMKNGKEYLIATHNSQQHTEQICNSMNLAADTEANTPKEVITGKTDSGKLFIACTWMDGIDVANYLMANKDMKNTKQYQLGKLIGEQLKKLHSKEDEKGRSLAHGDFYTGNIIYDKDKEIVKIIDCENASFDIDKNDDIYKFVAFTNNNWPAVTDGFLDEYYLDSKKVDKQKIYKCARKYEAQAKSYMTELQTNRIHKGSHKIIEL